jgi:subtilisin family serine protease
MHPARLSLRLPLLSTLILSVASLALTTNAFAAPRIADIPVRKLPVDVDRLAPIVPDLRTAPRAAVLDSRLRNFALSAVAQRQIQSDDGRDMVSVILKGSVASSALRAIGAEVGTDAGGFRTARIPVSALTEFLKLPGIENVALGYRLKPALDVSVGDAGAAVKRTEVPPLYGWTGKNVIVGIVDTGMDYQHDDFRNADNTTRFLSIWDQNTGGSPPAGFGYGNECTQAQINAGTCTEIDDNGHGSHVTGIAAGDGSATGNFEPAFTYVGMANGANIIGVATNFSTAGVVDGVNYVFTKAAALGRPAVVNLSLGTVLGPHDGSTSFEHMLDGLTGPGKIIVASAGNAQGDLVHASANLLVNTTLAYTFTAPTYTANAGANNDYIALDFWHAAANSYTIRVKRPSSSTLVGPVTKGNSLVSNTTDGQIIIDYTNSVDAGNGLSEIYVEVNDLPTGTPAPHSGTWRVDVQAGASEPGDPRVHSWMDGFLGVNGLVPTFAAGLIDTTVNIGSPGTADSLITVAAHTTKGTWASIDGMIYSFIGAVDPPQIATFSARGPRRDGALKPDISAPGSAIVSVLSGDSSPPWPDPLIVPDGVHLVLQGTSMSAPHATGAVALLLQKYPTLTPKGAKLLLAAGARSDATTGAVPNPRWGAGRLDLTSLLCTDTEPPLVSVSFPDPSATLFGGTEIGLTWSALDAVGVTDVKLEYRNGSLGSYTLIADHEPNDGFYAWTVPSIITDSLQVRVTANDCVGTGSGSSAFVRDRAASVDVEGGTPLSFAVQRPVPNPFTRTSALRFDLPAAPSGKWPVNVSVYNVAGRKMRTIVQGPLPAGRYTYEWDGRDDSGRMVSAGIYFLNVGAGPYSKTDRLLFLR